MTLLYTYRSPGRRPFVGLFFATSVFLTGVILWHAEPWGLLVFTLIPGGLTGWMLWANPVSGLRITEDSVVLSPEYRPKRVARSDIDHIKIRRGVDDEDGRIILTSGETVRIHGADLPPADALIAALHAAGITTRVT